MDIHNIGGALQPGLGPIHSDTVHANTLQQLKSLESAGMSTHLEGPSRDQIPGLAENLKNKLGSYIGSSTEITAQEGIYGSLGANLLASLPGK